MKLWWPFPSRPRQSEVEERSVSISDPAVAMMLGVVAPYGITVSETSAMTLSSVFRAVSLIAGSIASLPLRTLVDLNDEKQRTTSFLDNPHGRDGLTAFEWKELVMVHLLLHGNAFLQHVYNGAGAIAALQPIHPRAVEVEEDTARPGGRLYKVATANGTREFDARTMTHIMGVSLDGLRGVSPITLARMSFGTGIAGDKAAGKMFQTGAMVSGLVTPEEDLDQDEAKAIKTSLDGAVTGVDNAGSLAVINRKLKVQAWSLSAVDAQFLQSRAFQVEEVARWFGLPPHLLAQMEKQTSWGTGVSEQNRGLARYTLTPWTARIEQRLTRLLVAGKEAEFDYSAFVRPSPEDEIELLIKQVESGLLTLNEARRIRNMPPLPGGDTPRTGTTPPASGAGAPPSTSEVAA